MKSNRKIRPLLPAAATAALLCICIVFSSVAAVGTQSAVAQVSAASAPAAAQAAPEHSAAASSLEVELLAAQEETTFPATVLTQPAQPLPISQEDLRQMAADAEAEAAEAEAAEAAAEPAVPDDLVLIDHFTATAYCTTGTTATGTYTTVNRTLAVNPSMIPYGTHVWLFFPDGTLVGDFYAEDTGSNMMEHPYVIDIYKGADSYDECMQWGAQRVSVYVSASETN